MNQTLKVTINVNRDFSAVVRDQLEKFKITRFTLQSGRQVMLSGRSRFFGLGGAEIFETPLDTFEFFMKTPEPDHFLTSLITGVHLDTPGRGSLFTERVRIHSSDIQVLINKPEVPQGNPESLPLLFPDLLLISCIVQRGRGNEVAKAALQSVAGVPWISYGQGAGLRERLGLIRITIPADKEIVNLVVSLEEGPQVVGNLIRQARLNHPGQGFIYSSPIEKGLINTRLSMDQGLHMATMEQIIQSVDFLRGSPAWRRKAVTPKGASVVKKSEGEIEPEIDLTFYCLQGKASQLVEAARKVGASGATICKVRQGQKLIQGPREVMPALEAAHLVLRQSMEVKVLAALEANGLFLGEYPGYCEIKPVSHSFTYRPIQRT